MVGSDNDQRIVELPNLLKVTKSSVDGSVELEKLPKRAVVIERVHLLVDASGFRHEHEASVAVVLGAGGEDVDSLEGHIGQAGQVVSSLAATGKLCCVKGSLLQMASARRSPVGIHSRRHCGQAK